MIRITKNLISFLCEKKLLDSYNNFLTKNNLVHSKENLEKFKNEFNSTA
ncbi:MAG: hypothetical protein ACRCX2_09075 [Paraclostridium sp.]